MVFFILCSVFRDPNLTFHTFSYCDVGSGSWNKTKTMKTYDKNGILFYCLPVVPLPELGVEYIYTIYDNNFPFHPIHLKKQNGKKAKPKGKFFIY